MPDSFSTWLSTFLRERRKIALGIVCALCTIAVFLLYVHAIGFGFRLYGISYSTEPVRWLRELLHAEYATMDLRARYGQTSPRNDEFVYLSIDEPSISLTAPWPEEIEASRALTLMKKRWPFNREVYGLVIEKVMEAGAKAVVLDVLFAGPREGDDYFAKVLSDYPDQIVLGANFVYKGTDMGGGAGAEILQPPTTSLVPHVDGPVDWQQAVVDFFPDISTSFFESSLWDQKLRWHSPVSRLREDMVRMHPNGEGGGQEPVMVRDTWRLWGADYEIMPAIDPRVAYVNFFPNTDDVIRTALLRKQPVEGNAEFSSLAGRLMQITGREHLIPDNALNEPFLFRYTGPAFGPKNTEAGFRPRSIYEIFIPTMWEANYQNGAIFRDKTVLIGPDGNFHQDIHKTPYLDMPGPEIHLNVMNALLNQDFLEETSFRADVWLILGAGLFAWCCLVFFKSPAKAWTMFLTANVGYLALSVYLYNEESLYLLMVPPLLTFNLCGLAGSLAEFISEKYEKNRTRRTLERFVSKKIVKEVLGNRDNYYDKMGGKRLPVTVLFSDIRGFTTYTETRPEKEVIERLNEYLTEMGDAVEVTDGTLDKFIGDAVMAVWGNIHTEGPREDTRRAIETALSMRRRLETLNAKWKEEGYDPWAFGIGVHHGDAIVGAIGSVNIQQDPTIIGDSVNTGARLESYTKQYHLDLLVSETVAPHIEEEYVLRSVDKVVFKGKTKALEIFAVLEHRIVPVDPKEKELLEVYEEGIKLFRPPIRDFSAALAKFEAGLAIHPGDFLCQTYKKRAENYQRNPPPDDWQGEEVATSK